MIKVATKMKCPRCGSAMNHHADKLVYASSAQHAFSSDSGVIEEFHACPNCGAAASRSSTEVLGQ